MEPYWHWNSYLRRTTPAVSAAEGKKT